MSRCIGFKVLRALIARFLFALHSLITIWILYVDHRKLYYWAFAASPILLFVEGAFTIILRHGDEYKWFCPSVFIFLCGSVPPIWLLELETSIKAYNNVTHQADKNKEMESNVDAIHYWMLYLPELPGQQWFQVMEQSLLVILILGRWLLPKGRITRDELSQLLLAYLAISADIVELFNLFQETKVRTDLKLSIMVLILWSVSLIQFPLVITTVKSQKARYCFATSTDANAVPDPFLSPISEKTLVTDSESIKQPVVRRGPCKRCREILDKLCNVAVLGILSTILLQDLPFWTLRVYLVFWEDIMSYTMFFFICKNSLIMFVQIYRLIIICTTPSQSHQGVHSEDVENSPQKMHLLSAKYYSPYSTPEKHKHIHQDEPGPVPLISDLQRNGSVKIDPNINPLDLRRASLLNITGSVNAKDLVAKRKRRNALIDLKNDKSGKRKKSKENEPVVEENVENKESVVNVIMPQPDDVTFVSPDDSIMNWDL